jgi:hypothetical protein
MTPRSTLKPTHHGVTVEHPTLDGCLTRRSIALWLGGAVVVASTGTYLAYGPLSSEAWQQWSGTGAWKRDAVRALITAVLTFFLLNNLGACSGTSRTTFRLRGYEWVMIVVSGLVILALETVILPRSFMEGLRQRGHAWSDTFRDIYLPYFPYTLYMAGLWLGIALPNLLFLIRSIPVDYRWSRGNWETLRSEVDRNVDSTREPLEKDYRRLALAFEDYALGLKSLAQRYLPVIFVVTIALLYEQLTSSHLTVTDAAVEAGKVALWLLLGPAFLLCLLLVVFRYERAAKATLDALTGIANHPTVSSELFDSALAMRSELSWRRGTFQFVLSLFQSAPFTIAFVVAISSYVVSAAVPGATLVNVLVPRAIVCFVAGLFT